MIKYKHRANEVFHPLEYKALEIDVKMNDGKLVLGHDPDEIKCELIDFLDNCTSDTELAINIKQSGIADDLMNILSKYDIKSYFFFDMAVPDFLEYLKKYPEHTAFRWSNLSNEKLVFKCKWGWVDYFPEFGNLEDLDKLEISPAKWNLVIVSPELHDSKYRFKNIKNAYGICTDDI